MMKPTSEPLIRRSPFAILTASFLLFGLAAPVTRAADTVFSDDFESYTGAATSLEDIADADPAVPYGMIADDNPVGGTDGSGIQLIDWLAHSGSKALLLRAGSEAQLHLPTTRSGSRYTLDFWLYAVKGAGNRNFYIILRGEGTDNNGDDNVAYRSDRAATPAIFYYDGVGPGAGAWVNSGATHTEAAWQHHRIVADPNALTFDLYLDDMTTPVLKDVDLARPDTPVPTLVRVLHEGDSADDGYFVIDDISLTVEDSKGIAATFKDGFESYTALNPDNEDADPKGPWITTELNGNGSGKERVPTKVQVVDTSVITPHSGTNCVKIEGGQRAGISYAWGMPPQSDVEITWWAWVPASVDGATANYLRMSLYGSENGNCLAGDNALLGYGSRDGTIGDETSLTYYAGSGWFDTGKDYTPETWEEYRLITHTKQGTYSILKSPSSETPITVVDRAPFIGAATNWFPSFMVAWSSSNGSGHPPVYVDDIQIRSLDSNPEPLPQPYSVAYHTTRFTNATILAVTGPVGDMVVDPRDASTILFALDVAGGGIYKAAKAASGNWQVDPTPVVAGLDRPSGLTLTDDGTLWWTHDYNNDFTASVKRLKAPWAGNSPEIVIADCADVSGTVIDDDAIALTVAPAGFNGTIGKPGMIVVADRGNNGDTFNAVYLIDPATTDLAQTGTANYLVNPDPNAIGSDNLNAIAALPPNQVVTLTTDGWLCAIDAEGAVSYIWPATLWADTSGASPDPSGAALAVDPTTGRIWVADDTLDEIWSVDPATGADRKELSFPLSIPSRTDQQFDAHDPGMAFSPDGKFLVIADTSIANGGGRLIILHNEGIVFSATSGARTEAGITIAWQGTAFRYRVLRSTDLSNPAGFVEISGDLFSPTFTDTNPPAGQAFYRVVAYP